MKVSKGLEFPVVAPWSSKTLTFSMVISTAALINKASDFQNIHPFRPIVKASLYDNCIDSHRK